MANVTPTTTNYKSNTIHVWTPLTSANAEGYAVDVGTAKKKTVHIFGTPDSATVVLQGSLDGTNYSTLKDLNGNDLSFTTLTGGIIRDVPAAVKYIKPSTSGGSGSQSVTVAVLAQA